LAWLEKCAKEIQINGTTLLGRVIKAKGLKSIEIAVLSTVRLSKQEKDDPIYPIPWNELSQLLLNDQLELWGRLFSRMFLQRGKDVITLSFENLNISNQLEHHLKDIRQNPSSLDRNIAGYIWNRDDEQKIELTKKEIRRSYC